MLNLRHDVEKKLAKTPVGVMTDLLTREAFMLVNDCTRFPRKVIDMFNKSVNESAFTLLMFNFYIKIENMQLPGCTECY